MEKRTFFLRNHEVFMNILRYRYKKIHKRKLASPKIRHFGQKEREKFYRQIGKKAKKPIALFKCFRYNMRRNEQRGQGIYVHCVRFNARCPNGYVRSCRNAWPNKSGGFSE